MRTFWLLGLVMAILVGCSDDNEQSNNGNNANNTNNSTNNGTNNNTIVGVDCESNEDCSPPDNNCMGEVAVSYAGPGICSSEYGICNFTFVQESQDCAAINRSCEDGACVENACTNLECPAPEDFCTGNTLHFYTEDGECNLETASCDFEEFTTDCVAEGGECMFKTCIGACVGVACDAPPANTCTGNVAVTYPAAGMCDMLDGSCLYPPTMTNCEDTQLVCAGGACVADPCLNVTCPQPADSCDMNMTQIYSGDGVCNMANGLCDYSLVEVITDCAADLCVNAACTDVTPVAGELVLTEIMHDPNAVDDTLGEWFEITNASARGLDINGLIIGSANVVGYTIMLGQMTILAVGDTYVLGINGDMTTNGMVPVTSAYTDIVLDAVDSLTLTVGVTEIDAVVWDATWPATAGAAMQFGSNYDLVADDNAVDTFWCDATDALASGDLGTPGAMNGTCN